MARVESYVWLDPGLNKEPGPILLSEPTCVLRAVASRLRDRSAGPPRLAVVLTPYQMQPRTWWRSWRWRSWCRWPPIERESEAVRARRRFAATVQSEGLAVQCDDCLTGRPASLGNHFEVLNEFSAPWESLAVEESAAQGDRSSSVTEMV